MKRALAGGVLAGAALVAGSAAGYSPEVNYALQCRGCHSENGAGERGRVPSVRRALARLSRTEAGRTRLVHLPGIAQADLSDEDLAALLNWMLRTLNDEPVSHLKPYTAVEIGARRATRLP